MRHAMVLGAAFAFALAAPPAAASSTYSGNLTGPGYCAAAPFCVATVSARCGATVLCEPLHGAGYQGVNSAREALSPLDPGKPFTLTGLGTPHPYHGLNLNLAFYDATGSLLAFFGKDGDEAGTVPAGATHADVHLFSGFDVRYTLTVG